MSESLSPERPPGAEYLESLSPDQRIATAKVWAQYVEKSLNFKPEAAFEGTLWHLRFTLAEIDRLRARVAELEQQVVGLDDLRLRAIDKGDALRDQLAKIERDNPAAAFTHACNIPLTRRLDCGHCPHEVCQDCDRCPHSCRCGSTEGGDR